MLRFPDLGAVIAQYNQFRSFPTPWTVEQQEACFVVRDHSGQQLAYVYFGG